MSKVANAIPVLESIVGVESKEICQVGKNSCFWAITCSWAMTSIWIPEVPCHNSITGSLDDGNQDVNVHFRLSRTTKYGPGRM